MSSDTNRTQGIDFNGLDETLQSVTFPVTADTLREEHGEHELGFVGGSTTLGEVLSTLETTRFESVEEVLQAVKNGVGSEAIGRQRYTDRGGTANVEDTTLDSL